MRSWLLPAVYLIALNAKGQAGPSKVWTELREKRESVAGLHQEFEVTQTVKTARASQGSHRTIVVDMSQGKWRESVESGSGDRVRIFDGRDLFLMEAEGDEYLRIKRKPKEDDPAPVPYAIDGIGPKQKRSSASPVAFQQMTTSV